MYPYWLFDLKECFMPSNGNGRRRVPARCTPTGRFVYPEEGETVLTEPSEVMTYLLTHVFASAVDIEQEELWALLLTQRNRVIARVLVYRGTLSSAPMRVGDIFREAVRANAAAILLTHCHPSGNPEPSADDLATTKQIDEAGKLMDIILLDHVIVGGNGRFVSLSERGVIRGRR